MISQWLELPERQALRTKRIVADTETANLSVLIHVKFRREHGVKDG